ncbi:MAG TPA: hypothetical protein LFW13_05675 [Rickettsia endosymbiont of Sericostoma sp.]|nr:hypothetical protein [Rickettsia endosymbiont of Sericostoma sp.]
MPISNRRATSNDVTNFSSIDYITTSFFRIAYFIIFCISAKLDNYKKYSLLNLFQLCYISAIAFQNLGKPLMGLFFDY